MSSENTSLDDAREEFKRLAPGGPLRYTHAQRLEDAIRAVVRDELERAASATLGSLGVGDEKE